MIKKADFDEVNLKPLSKKNHYTKKGQKIINSCPLFADFIIFYGVNIENQRFQEDPDGQRKLQLLFESGIH